MAERIIEVAMYRSELVGSSVNSNCYSFETPHNFVCSEVILYVLGVHAQGIRRKRGGWTIIVDELISESFFQNAL